MKHIRLELTKYTGRSLGFLDSSSRERFSLWGPFPRAEFAPDSYRVSCETGLYYLQTRYYNPELGRFINADVLISTGQGILGNNMFAYCGNSPVGRTDLLGKSFAVVLGFNFNFFGRGGAAAVNFVSSEDNLGVQFSYYLPDDARISKKQNETVGVDFGTYVGVQYTDKNNMKDLEGLAKTTGGDLLLRGDILTDENGE